VSKIDMGVVFTWMVFIVGALFYGLYMINYPSKTYDPKVMSVCWDLDEYRILFFSVIGANLVLLHWYGKKASLGKAFPTSGNDESHANINKPQRDHANDCDEVDRSII
jgi:hypothetical protein